jgi:hypothetical protein|tara:strand:- start:3108 stop:3680 length:573 start_codon:yes stop_codon:yes gene_type:complete
MVKKIGKRQKKQKKSWTKFVKTNPVPDEATIQNIMKDTQRLLEGVSEAQARQLIIDEYNNNEIYVNNKYQVAITRQNPEKPKFGFVLDNNGERMSSGSFGVIHLSVKTHDKEPIRDWRDMQRIKNELVGEEHEAVELYPAESRLVDTANQYHMWVFDKPVSDGAYYPFGFHDRLVNYDKPLSGAVQRGKE